MPTSLILRVTRVILVLNVQVRKQMCGRGGKSQLGDYVMTPFLRYWSLDLHEFLLVIFGGLESLAE